MVDTTGLPRDRFFAAYIQAVHPPTGARWQWILLPPVSMPEDARYDHRMVWWEREQTLNRQKPSWRFRYSTPGSAAPDVIMNLNEAWVYSEPIVVKTDAIQVRRLIVERSTPYPLINALERKAALRGIVIQGPTSKPQVVSSPPSA